MDPFGIVLARVQPSTTRAPPGTQNVAPRAHPEGVTMATRIAVLVSALALLLLPACGGGGSDAYVPSSQNNAEKELTGTYQLVDFSIFEAGTPPTGPSHYEEWYGGLELRPDGTASVGMEFCEHAGTATSQCEREFVWSADAGLIHLVSTDPSEHDILMRWENSGMGALRTESLLPTNDENCGLFIADDGFETLDWIRTN